MQANGTGFFTAPGAGAAYIADAQNTAGDLNYINVDGVIKYINITDDNVVAFTNAAMQYAIDNGIMFDVTKTSTGADVAVDVDALGYYLMIPVDAYTETPNSSGSVSDPQGGMLDFLIIDGQQRLTTVSLIFLAMYNLMQEGKAIPQKSNLAVQIYETYLIDKFEDDESKIKLKPIKNDQKAFEALFDPDLEKVADSNLTINYNYFYNRIQREEISIDELFDAIRKLQIINISLNHEDNPQLIFESLNSTGMALSEDNKIRNYILMGLPIITKIVFI